MHYSRLPRGWVCGDASSHSISRTWTLDRRAHCRLYVSKAPAWRWPSADVATLEERILVRMLLLPRGGFLAATPAGASSFRLRQSFFIAGGSIADGLMLFGGYRLIVAMYGSLGDSFLRADGAVASVLLLWTLGSALTGLLPTKASLGGRRFLTDGYLLLRLWTASNQQLAEWASISDWRKALDLLQGADENRKAIRNAGSREPQGSASSSENLRILQAQRSRLASEVLRRSGMEGGSA
jgi:hypothetical protein